MKVLGSVISAVLPLVTTYYAALTTTALAAAYAGDAAAGQLAIVYVVITAALGLFWGAFNSVDRYIQQLMSFKVGAIVGDQMYERFLALEFWRYDDKETVDLYDRAKRFSDSYARVLDRIAAIFTQLVSVLLAIGALLLVSWWIAVIVLVAIVPSVYLQFKLSREQIAHWNTQVDSRRQRRMIETNLLRPQHIAEMRLYGIVTYLMDFRSRLRDADERRRLDFQRRYIPKQLAADALQYGAEVVSLIWVVGQIIARAQPVGQFLYVQQIVSRALSTANNLVSSLSSIDEDLANLKDYELFMALPAHSEYAPPLLGAPSVELKDIRFTYTGSDTEVIRGISLTIREGQHIAIVGENGAGKSTLIRILAGLYRPDSGQVMLDGVDLAAVDVTSWHRHLAVLSQEFLKYEFATAAENIWFGDVGEPRDDARIRTVRCGSRGAGLHRKAAQRAQQPRQQLDGGSPRPEGERALRRAMAAPGDGPELLPPRRFYDHGRAHLGDRRPGRAPDLHPAVRGARQHHHRHQPPPGHHREGGHCVHAGGRAGGGAGHPQGTCGPPRQVLPDVRIAAWRPAGPLPDLPDLPADPTGVRPGVDAGGA